MNLYLAIDAGGTKTVCCVANEERELARLSCGTVKLMRVPEQEATERIVGLVTEASGVAGISLEDVTRTCMGIAGLSIPEVRLWAERTLGRTVGGELLLCGDEVIALGGGVHGWGWDAGDGRDRNERGRASGGWNGLHGWRLGACAGG